MSFTAGGSQRVLRGKASGSAQWQPAGEKENAIWRLTATADGKTPVLLRLDIWQYRGQAAAPSAQELASLIVDAPVISDNFDAAARPAKLPPEAKPIESVQPLAERSAIQPQENIDDFTPTRGKFLRFVITRATNNSEPGLDELEVYGADLKENLALKGRAPQRRQAWQQPQLDQCRAWPRLGAD